MDEDQERKNAPSPKPAVDVLTTGAVAWRIEQRAGRYTFVEHVENLKLYAGANIVPLFRAFRSVDADLNTLLDRLESMVTWEPRLLSGHDAIDRLEHINRALYEFLNPHPASEPKALTLTDEQLEALVMACKELGAAPRFVLELGTRVQALLADRGSENP